MLEGVLELTQFQKIDIGHVINKLHELEDSGTAETRSHGIGFRSMGGRTILAQSPSLRDSVLGELEVDTALRGIRKRSVGHIGNLYWLPANPSVIDGNAIVKEVRTVLIGNKKRINFPTPNTREVIEYALSRVRALSK